jgi:hypothetical protein
MDHNVLVDKEPVDSPSGTRATLSVITTTSDVSADRRGTAYVYGSLSTGGEIGFHVPLSIYSDDWFRRLCDAIHHHHEYVYLLCSVKEVDGRFVIPAAPSRDGDAVVRLVRKGMDAKFKDLIALKSGRDRFSRMKLPELKAAVGEHVVEQACEGLGIAGDDPDDDELAKVLRWIMRGLPVYLALRKVEADQVISENAAKSAWKR